MSSLCRARPVDIYRAEGALMTKAARRLKRRADASSISGMPRRAPHFMAIKHRIFMARMPIAATYAVAALLQSRMPSYIAPMLSNHAASLSAAENHQSINNGINVDKIEISISEISSVYKIMISKIAGSII